MENGKYKAVVISHALDESKNGTASVKIVCQTKYEVENPAFPVNATMYHDLWLSPACFERSMHTLTKVLGWKGEIFEELNDNNTLLAGAECVLVVENEEYQGKLIPKVKFINGVQKKLDSDKAKALSNSLADQLRAYKTKSPGVKQTTIPGADMDEPLPITKDFPLLTDDDMPF